MKSTRSKIAALAVSASLIGMTAGFAGLASLASAAVGGPTVVLSTSATTTNATSAPVTATFSEGVSGFTASGVTATGGTVSNFAGSGSTYTFDVAPVSATGTVSVMVPADVASSTASSTGNQASNPLVLLFTSATSTATTSAPVISNVMVTNIGSTTATVSWNTDMNASTQVMYGTTASYGQSSTLDSTATTSHSVVLSNLAEGTVYHYSVQSSSNGQMASSSDAVFVTQSTSSSTPLAVTGVDAVKTSAIADGSFADGWQWTMHLTVPDNEDAFRMAFTDFANSTNASTTIPAKSDIRIFSPESSNANSEATAITSTGNGFGGWMNLNGDTGTTTPGRQIDVTIEVAVPLNTPTGSYSTTFTAQSVPQSATSTTP